MKKLVFLKLILIFAVTFLFARSSGYPNQTKQKRRLCCNVDDSDLFKKNEEVFFVNGEFLFWTASAGDNEYAFQYDKAALNAGSSFGLGKYVFSKYDWDPGFRVAFGWFYAPNTYQVIWQFTWIRMDNTETTNRKEPFSQPLVATFPQYNILGQQLSQAKSRVRLNHELGDFLASRVWNPNLHLRLSLFGGFTGGRIQQKYNITYTDVISQIEKVNNRWKFTGIGFRLGVAFDWFWSCHFYLTGKASFAPLVGKYKYLGQISDVSNGIQYADFRYDQYRGAYNIQAYLGPSYQRAYTNNRFEIFLGYELNGWFNVHEIIRNDTVTNSRYLSSEVIPRINSGLFLLHGLTARLTVDF